MNILSFSIVSSSCWFAFKRLLFFNNHFVPREKIWIIRFNSRQSLILPTWRTQTELKKAYNHHGYHFIFHMWFIWKFPKQSLPLIFYKQLQLLFLKIKKKIETKQSHFSKSSSVLMSVNESFEVCDQRTQSPCCVNHNSVQWSTRSWLLGNLTFNVADSRTHRTHRKSQTWTVFFQFTSAPVNHNWSYFQYLRYVWGFSQSFNYLLIMCLFCSLNSFGLKTVPNIISCCRIFIGFAANC